EATLAIVFDERVAHRGPGTMFHGERHDRVFRARQPLVVVELHDLDGNRHAIDAELLRAFQIPPLAFRSPQAQNIRTSLQRQGELGGNGATIASIRKDGFTSAPLSLWEGAVHGE